MRKHRIIYGGILVCLIISFFTKDSGFILLGIGAGAIGGLCVEYTGVKIVKLWGYAGGGLPIWAILRGWGETGAMTVVAALWIPHPIIALFAGLLFPLLAFELPNIRTKGWNYHAPSWLVVVGWGITVFSFQSTARAVALLTGRGL